MEIHNSVKLKSLDMDSETIVYEVKSNNGLTTLEQSLELIRRPNGEWFARMDMLGMEPQKTPKGAALRLSDWFIRMGGAIKNGDFSVVEKIFSTGEK